MKILICTNHSYMFWQFRREMTMALLEQGEVVLSTPFVGHEKDLEALGCRMIDTPIDRRGMNPVTDMKLISFYKKLIKAENPDLVITYSIKPNIYAGSICRSMHIPYCINVQGLGTAFEKNTMAAVASSLYKHACRDARTVFFENAGDAGEFVKRGIMPAEKQTILYGAGVNLDFYTYQTYPQNDPFRFLYLGRIMKEKGVMELFEASERLQREGYRFVLDVVGFYDDESEEEKDTIHRLVQQGIIEFHGFDPEPKKYYAMTDCVVMPSYHEGMSNVLLEAAATGRPLITTNINGCKEAVEDTVTGYLCNVKDAEDLYLMMKQVLSLSREEREKMGRAGRERMYRVYNKKLVVANTMKGLFR